MDQPVAAPSIPEIDHYELDGIPLYHIPMPGQTVLSLDFGVGRAHEPPIQGGLTHLAEHLILMSIDDVLDHANGTTQAFRVSFTTRGTPAHVSRFLRDVCEAIDHPPISRMHQEAKVLRTEAAGRSLMPLSLKLMWMRTGYQGIGNLGLPEFFLDSLDPDVLRAWIAQHFVAGNAAIWVAGEIPDDLAVILPPGPRTEPVVQRWIDGFETPAAYRDDVSGVGASFLVDRSAATSAGFRSLDRRLTKRTRVDRGLGYQIGSDWIPVDPGLGLATVWVTCLPEAEREVQQIMFETIDDVAARGPTDDELSNDYQSFPLEIGDPHAIPGRLDAHVRDVLLGGDPIPRPVASMIDERWRLESAHVAAAFKKARDSMFLLLPEHGGDPQREFKRYPGPAPGSMAADRTFEFIVKEKRGLLKKKEPVPRLSVGRLGVAIDSVSGRRLTAVTWADCVAVVRERDVRRVIGRDGLVVAFHRSDWRDGAAALGLVDRFAPPDRIVRVDA